MTNTVPFSDVARLPLPNDNVAIATQPLEAGVVIQHNEQSFTLSHNLLEGHRFAIQPIVKGEHLLSWGLPFGVATRTINPGDYACNPQILDALSLRDLAFALPSAPNFEDRIVPYDLEETRFQAGTQTPRYENTVTFQGFKRPGNRGVGTRNSIVIIGTSSRTASYAKSLCSQLSPELATYENIDDIVPIAHTEGGGTDTPNNIELLLRTLAGFMVHPNVGAVLAVDYGTEAITNKMLQDYMNKNGYPLSDVTHHFLTIQDSFEASLEKGAALVRDSFVTVNTNQRREQPLSHLKIALQCGGSDAFSGISGNPLISWVARETIRNGGAANLAETDELIGAEPYVLQNCKSADVAQRFLKKVEGYKTLAAWHGTSAEGNPSGGNKFRGLYNIVLKSIGAAMKRHPEVCLDEVIDYGAPMNEPGYYFMDSPGNDLESIAGQVASGCNIIFFVTGNGSITNFPFVPTLKVVTTTERYNLLSKDMDVNAGAYLDGTSMDDLGQSMFDLTREVASGKRSKGEEAGHAQVSIWRAWPQTSADNLIQIQSNQEPKGQPIGVHPLPTNGECTFQGLLSGPRVTTNRIGLILPTSLCSGQIANMAANRLTELGIGKNQGISRFVGLAHTEGCGVAGETAERLYTRTMVGYLSHPLIHRALLLEHGCEKTHNDYLRHALQDKGLSAEDFGWASVQLDGGIDQVLDKIQTWFETVFASEPNPQETSAPISNLKIALHAAGPLSETAADSLAQFSRQLVGAGATVIVPDTATFLEKSTYTSQTFGLESSPQANLAHGQQPTDSGYYIMETQTDHWVETLTGLGGTGVEVVIACSGEHPKQGHPLIPMIQVAASETLGQVFKDDFDLTLGDVASQNAETLLNTLTAVASRKLAPKATLVGNTDFQFTRGLLGVSM
ncbi:MAG: altronate hydrolase [Candidatus Latescibacteria bacterium]|nr:altronate hydrolase [Candidatus Latescibacterota bacterium]MBT4141077.1 altronate hydrolase [Candidatus Latescibacterota bacterium]